MYSSTAVELKLEDVKIDPEFRDLCPHSSASELAQLEANIAAEGCRDALVLWGGVLIDGHTRREICLRLGVEPKIVSIQLPDREAAINWIISNQLGRRNLSAAQRTYLIGKRQLVEKGAHGGSRSRSQSATLKCADRIAGEAHVDRATVYRAGSFAAAVDRVEAAVPGTRAAILGGELPATKSAVAALADVPDEQLPAAVEALKAGEGPVGKSERAAGVQMVQGVLPDVEIEPVDLVVADLQHVADFKAVYGSAGAWAARSLRDGGSFLVSVAPTNVSAAQAAFSESFPAHRIVAQLPPVPVAGQPSPPSPVAKPALWFMKQSGNGDPWNAAIVGMVSASSDCVIRATELVSGLAGRGRRVIVIDADQAKLDALAEKLAIGGRP